MKELDTSCKGWARMQAALDNEKKFYYVFHIDLNRQKYGITDFHKVIGEVDLSDKKINPYVVEDIKNFEKCTRQSCAVSEALQAFIRQRLEKFPFTGSKHTDTFLMHSASLFEVYLEDQDKIQDFLSFLQRILDEVSNITGIFDIGIKDYENLKVNIPKNEQLSSELQYDDYGNFFEVGDYVARSGFNRTSVFADIVIGRTERSLILLSGGNCHPKNVFVIRKHDGSPVSFSR